MHYYSTSNSRLQLSLVQALQQNLAPDKGLFMPQSLPKFELETIKSFAKLSYGEVAANVLSEFFAPEIEHSKLLEICQSVYNFDLPIQSIDSKLAIAYLDQGPTAAFKDFAALLLARLLPQILGQKMTILVATSGDTGGAVARAFAGIDDIEVFVLFPENEVSARQRKVMTTLSENIHCLSVGGKFDDCQTLAKQALVDTDLKSLNFISANSISVGRLLPQIAYYFYIASRLWVQNPDSNLIFSVPSGNFGNLTAGVIARQMGLPIKKFIAATNDNNSFEKLLQTEKYEPIIPSKNSLSNAMNVGNPSNLARLVNLFGGELDSSGNLVIKPDFKKLKEQIWTASVTDTETKDVMKKFYKQQQVILEPHGAVGLRAIEKYQTQFDQPDDLYVLLETASPAKFETEIQEILGITPEVPASLASLDIQTEFVTKIDNSYNDLKKYLQRF